MHNNQRLIQLTEVSAIDFPVSNDYKYKCRVQVIADKGQTLLQKDLFARMQPSWLAEIREEVNASGTYTHTYEELAYGAQLAWRNASKCIGRIQWNNMVVRDRRHVTDPDEMFQELVEHLRIGTNGGNLQITMTAFRLPSQAAERTLGTAHLESATDSLRCLRIAG